MRSFFPPHMALLVVWVMSNKIVHEKLSEVCNWPNSMEQSPRIEADSCSALWGAPCVLWNLWVHHYICKSMLLLSIMSQVNPFHTLTLYFFKVHINIIPIYIWVSQVIFSLQVF
jgi:hypothetical protein